MYVSIKAKFYFDHTKQQVIRHKCNSCLGICSIFIVVVISASCYTLVQDTPVVFYRQAEQIYGQYDMIISPPRNGEFLDYPLTASLLDSRHSLSYHSPRIRWNETGTTIYPPSCSLSIRAYTASACPSSPMVYFESECSDNIKEEASVWLIDFEREQRMHFGRTFDAANTPNRGEVILTESTAERLGVGTGETIYIAIPLNSDVKCLIP